MTDPADGPGPNDSKPASASTQALHSAAVINFDDATDFEAASRGLLAQHQTGVITMGDRTVFDTNTRDFLRTGDPAPDTVHPGLWRQGQLNAAHGLFEVAEGVYQARGYDLANITFMVGDTGWVIIDPLSTEQTAAACLALANETLGERPVKAVIYTHSHIDHYGGVQGVTTPEAVAAGDVRIIAPEGFMREAVSENCTAGPIMIRRAHYQFGPLLPVGPQGHVDCGLGQAVPIGMARLIAPTEDITETGAELVVDGIRVIFQNTPDAEAPAEMNFFFPDKGLLCMAENCSHNLHNLYPIRGAQTRDALAWSKYLQEALLMWGDQTDIMFASHHWPRFGNDDVKAFLALQRDVYRWMHDQTLRLANHGHTPDEISDMLSMPESYANQSHVQGYYGTVSHNVRSVYNRYLGWYDGNPANLHPHTPVDSGKRYVEMMGGADKVIEGARVAFADGDYRWVTQVLNHVIFVDPANQVARQLSADAMEQMGYQSESSTWRNAYLTGALELRHGSFQLGPAARSSAVDAMDAEQLFEMIGVRFNPALFTSTASIAWTLSDVDETHLVGVSNSAIHHQADPSPAVIAGVDASVTLNRSTLIELVQHAEKFAELVADGSLVVTAGDAGVVQSLFEALDVFLTPTIIEPRPARPNP